MTESLAETTWTNETALLVIDVQKGVVVDGFDRDGVVSRIAGLIGYARGHQIPVIYIQHEAPDYPPMARGGGDWEIVDEIAWPEKAKPQVAQGVAFFNLMRNLTASGFYTTQMGVKDIGYIGNMPNQWNGVPADVLQQYGLAYSEKELRECYDPNKS